MRWMRTNECLEMVLFAREDYVEEASRIVDPVQKANTPLCEYEARGDLLRSKKGWCLQMAGTTQ
jgi:hypothetical protein